MDVIITPCLEWLHLSKKIVVRNNNIIELLSKYVTIVYNSSVSYGLIFVEIL